MASLPRAFRSGWAETAMFAHALPELFPLFRRHGLPPLSLAAAELGATSTVASQSAEKNPAQCQHSKCLPEGKLVPAEKRRQQPVPQLLHYFAAEGDEQQNPQYRQWGQVNPFLFHIQSPRLPVNSS